MASVSISRVPTEAEWLKLQARYLAAFGAQEALKVALDRKYSDAMFARRTERARLETLRERTYKAEQACCAWLYEHSPRRWSTGCPVHWICSRLTYADALTTGPLSVVPPLAYGQTEAHRAAFCRSAQG